MPDELKKQLEDEAKDLDSQEATQENNTETKKPSSYVDPIEQMFDQLTDKAIEDGKIFVYGDDEEVVETTTDKPAEEAKPATADEPAKDDKTSSNDDLKVIVERLNKQEQENAALRAELIESQKLLLEALKAPVKAEPEQPKKTKEQLANEETEKLKSGLQKILEGDASAVDELLAVLAQPKVDVAELARKEAEQIAARKIQEHNENQNLQKFHGDYVNSKTEFKNDAFAEIFSNNLMMVAQGEPNLTLNQVYDKAFNKSVDFAKKLGFKLEEQSANQPTQEELDHKAKLEKAKAASVPASVAGGKQVGKPSDEKPTKHSAKSNLQDFLEVNHPLIRRR